MTDQPADRPPPWSAGDTTTAARPTSGQRAWVLAVRVVLLVTAIALGIWLFSTLFGVIVQILMSIILATGLRPLVDRLVAGGVPRGVAVLAIYLSFLLSLVVLFAIVVPPLLGQIEDLVAHAPTYGDQLVDLLQDLQTRFPFLPPLDTQITAQLRQLGSQIGAIASQALVLARFAIGIFGGLLTVTVVLLMTLYLIVDGERIRNYFLSFLPAAQHERLQGIGDRIGERMGGWLIGQVTLSAVIGTCSFIGLTVLGVRGAILLALLAAIGEAIPIVGPIASAVPAIIVGLTYSVFQGVAVLVLYLVIQQVENNFLVPKIMERAVELHPLAVIVALLVGGDLYGITGTILAVPVAAAISVVLNEFRATPPISLPIDGQPDETAAGTARLVVDRSSNAETPAAGGT